MELVLPSDEKHAKKMGLDHEFCRHLTIASNFCEVFEIDSGFRRKWPTAQEWMIWASVACDGMYFDDVRGYERKIIYSFLLHVPSRTPVVCCKSYFCENLSGYQFLNGCILSWGENGTIIVHTKNDRETTLTAIDLPCTVYYRKLFFSATSVLPLVLQQIILGYLYEKIADDRQSLIFSLNLSFQDEDFNFKLLKELVKLKITDGAGKRKKLKGKKREIENVANQMFAKVTK